MWAEEFITAGEGTRGGSAAQMLHLGDFML